MPLTIILIIIVLGLFVLLLIWLQPEGVISRLQHRSPDVLYAVNTKDKVVALTIDDGPDALTSPLILDLLHRYEAKATFFIITDHIPGNEDIIERMVSEGHELGNHMTLDEASILLSLPEFESKLLEADSILSQYSDINWIRPGSGWYNDDMLSVIDDNGYKCALGSIYPFDPQLGSAWFSANYVLRKASPGEIIVLHDYKNRGLRTVKALEQILPDLDERGYRIVTLSEIYALGNGHQP